METERNGAADPVYRNETEPNGAATDQVAYLQQLLDRTQGELADYKRGFIDEIRHPLLMELITLAHTVENFLAHDDAELTVEDYRNFLKLGVLGDLHQALNRYDVEPFICSTKSVNRRLQTVERVLETDDSRRAGQVRPLTRGYAHGDRVLHKEHVALYKLRDGA